MRNRIHHDADDFASIGYKSLRYKLLRSHLGVAVAGLLVLMLFLIAGLFLTEKSRQLALIADPQTYATIIEMRRGIQNSLIALHGWVALPDKQFLQDWATSWQKTIWPNVYKLRQIKMTTIEVDYVMQLHQKLADLEEWQWYIEDVAHTIGNLPARSILLRKIYPTLDLINAALDSVINTEYTLIDANRPTNLVVDLTKLRANSLRINVQLDRLIDSANIVEEKEFYIRLQTMQELIAQLLQQKTYLTVDQYSLLEWLQNRLQAFVLLAQEAITIRKSPHWNVAQHLLESKTMPLAREIENLLTAITRQYEVRLRIETEGIFTLTNLLFLLFFPVLLAMISTAIFLSKRGAERIMQPIRALVRASRDIATGKLNAPIPSSNDDELGILTDSFNAMLAALEKKQKELQLLASMDSLTGIANRRCFSEVIQKEWLRCAREQLPVSVILVDIDHFKAYNDTRGHQVGDTVLKQIATVIAIAAQRPSDLAARYGGEEFIVLLPNTDSMGTHHVAEKIQCGIKELGIPSAVPEISPYLTVSMGIASCIPQDVKWELLLKVADDALYRAKHNGRNQICNAHF